RLRDYSQLPSLIRQELLDQAREHRLLILPSGGRAVTLAMLMKIESILCPTDLSPDSAEALRYAVAMSRAYGAELILLHCDTGAPSPNPDAHDSAAQTIKDALVKYSGSADLEGLDWKSVVITCDDAGEAIAREAALLRVDLIAMRSRRRPHRAALLGSTAETVSRTAPCPVLVMHSDE